MSVPASPDGAVPLDPAVPADVGVTAAIRDSSRSL